MSEKIVQTAGKDQLGSFAPEFSHFNDDIFFGENWNKQKRKQMFQDCFLKQVPTTCSSSLKTQANVMLKLKNRLSYGSLFSFEKE